MFNKKIVIIDGSGNEDNDLTSPLAVLIDLLTQDKADVKCYNLKKIKLAHCIGCFGCWIKTPGICMMPDEGKQIIQAIIQSEMTILFSPVTFGGYSSALKIIVDRFIPLILPYFGKYYGETHHLPRYSHYPRLVGIGIQRYHSEAEAKLFKTLVGRHAINFHAPSYSADVFNIEEDNGTLRSQFESVILRSDPFPIKDNIITFFPKADMAFSYRKHEGTRNALLIIGSPKIKERSTSSIFGKYLLEKIAADGCNTEELTLKGNLNREKGQLELCAAIDRSDLIILAFPLYIDSLPFLVTKALEVIANHLTKTERNKPQGIFTIINNGFPEFYQNALALGICCCFAEQCNIAWAGYLAAGAGEGLGAGQELTQPKRFGPPVNHVIKALNIAGKDLANGTAVSINSQNFISKVPIPILPFSIWRWLFPKFGAQFWKRKAIENNVRKEELYAKPYAD
ncbi:MAG: NAD(P)H-dependent oxidoreductase [Desulfobacteraceae bacterium]|nr:NAD(P)H-dependent oxidoreductase [Desulfobacteraceae bacterium]